MIPILPKKKEQDDVPISDDLLGEHSSNKITQEAVSSADEKLHSDNIRKFMDFWEAQKARIEIVFNSKQSTSESKIAPIDFFGLMQEILDKQNIHIRELTASNAGFFDNQNNAEKIFKNDKQLLPSSKECR